MSPIKEAKKGKDTVLEIDCGVSSDNSRGGTPNEEGPSQNGKEVHALSDTKCGSIRKIGSGVSPNGSKSIHPRGSTATIDSITLMDEISEKRAAAFYPVNTLDVESDRETSILSNEWQKNSGRNMSSQSETHTIHENEETPNAEDHRPGAFAVDGPRLPPERNGMISRDDSRFFRYVLDTLPCISARRVSLPVFKSKRNVEATARAVDVPTAPIEAIEVKPLDDERPFIMRHKSSILACLLTVVVLGIALGLAFGLKGNSSSSSFKPDISWVLNATALGGEFHGALGWSLSVDQNWAHAAFGEPSFLEPHKGEASLIFEDRSGFEMRTSIEGARINFGQSVALSYDGTRVAIKSGGPKGTNFTQVDVIRLKEASNTKDNTHRLEMNSTIKWLESFGDWSSRSVSLSKDGFVLAFGSLIEDKTGETRGALRVYQNLNDGWNMIGDEIIGDANEGVFGISVSLSGDGNRVAMGTFSNNNGDSSIARVYDYNGVSWNQTGQDLGSGCNTSVSLSHDGSTIAVGSSHGNEANLEKGVVKVYQFVDEGWDLLGAEIVADELGDGFGHDIALANEGYFLAVGAPYSKTGYVKVFNYDGSSWMQVGPTVHGEVEGGWAGYSVAVSKKPPRVALGSPHNNVNGLGAGSISVYHCSCG